MPTAGFLSWHPRAKAAPGRFFWKLPPPKAWRDMGVLES